MNSVDRKQHWEEAYRQKSEDAVSWFQPQPEVSLALLHVAGIRGTDAIVDVGGGASRLADHLLAAGFSDITVLDIAEGALNKAQQRLGKVASKINWIATDITQWQPKKKYRLWHDRAVFHFLSDPADRTAYRRNLETALMPGGWAIIASFALDGPERCSGLPVQRYSPESLAAELGKEFQLESCRNENHQTPDGNVQRFQYSVLQHRL